MQPALGVPLLVLAILSLCGHFTLQPNEARVLMLFGAYKGTTRRSGFHWTNPFYTKRKISLRARTFNAEKLKVNDKTGNPIEIAAVKKLCLAPSRWWKWRFTNYRRET